MILYKEILLKELQEHIDEIDISERGRLIYHWVDGEVKPKPEEWDRPRWEPGAWRDGTWVNVLSHPGAKAWGAFEDDKMVGMIVYRPHLTDNTAQLSALFVSRGYRRRGISTQLTAQLERQARLDGHTELYVSATPSESAVNFYRSCGFTPTTQVNLELFALEPEDIHMIKAL